jgi:hypothetical protein
MTVFWLTPLIFTSCSNSNTSKQQTESTTEYYFANSVITLRPSSTRLEEEYWIERVKDPIVPSIKENWIASDGTLSSYEFYPSTVEQTFELSIFLGNNLDSEGTGFFEGQGLDWSYWEYNLVQSDGVTVITHGEKDDEGILLSSVGYGMDGNADWTLDDVLTPISQADWSEAIELID